MFPRSFTAALVALLIAVPLVRAQSKTGNVEMSKPQPQPVVTLPDQSKLDDYLSRWEKETKNFRTLDIACERKRFTAAFGSNEILDNYVGSIKFMKVDDRNGPVVL